MFWLCIMYAMLSIFYLPVDSTVNVGPDAAPRIWYLTRYTTLGFVCSLCLTAVFQDYWSSAVWAIFKLMRRAVSNYLG